MSTKAVCERAVGALLLIAASAAWTTPVQFSGGFSFPFTISQAPQAFGTYGGAFFIPDITTREIKVVPPGGLPPDGLPAVFAKLDATIRGGLFLPPDFGAVGGQFALLTVIPDPTDPAASQVGRITTFDATATPTAFSTGLVNPVTLFDPAIAPQGFGSYGGQLFMTTQSDVGAITRVDHDGVMTPFSAPPKVQVPGIPDPVTINPTGLAFAPAGFGSVEGMMLTNDVAADGSAAYIIALDPDGNASLFASVPLMPGRFAPRQMAFAPADFGPYAGMLFLSIASSNDNSGIFGAIEVIDSLGHDVATLLRGSVADDFNPRGMLFLPGGQLLISNAVDPIDLATPADFAAPEPGSGLLLCVGLTALFFVTRRGVLVSACQLSCAALRATGDRSAMRSLRAARYRGSRPCIGNFGSV